MEEFLRYWMRWPSVEHLIYRYLWVWGVAQSLHFVGMAQRAHLRQRVGFALQVGVDDVLHPILPLAVVDQADQRPRLPR